VIDASGIPWDVATQIVVANEAVTFGADFDDFSKQCGGRRRNYFVYKAPSILDPIWNPANVYQRFVEGGIRTQQAASLPESPPW
jgi:hypothetical protein